MNLRPDSALRAAAPAAALAVAFALAATLATTSTTPAATDQLDGSLDVVLAELPPPAPDAPPRAPTRGALVVEVETGGAGDRAGLLEGDIIIEFENQPVRSAAALSGWIRREGEGSLVSIWVWRDGDRKWLGLTHLSGRMPRLRAQRELLALRDEVAALRDEVAALHDDVDSLRAELARRQPRWLPADTSR